MGDLSIDFESLEKILSGKSLNTSKKSKTQKGKTIYPFGKPSKNNNPTNKMTMSKRQKIARLAVEKLINVASLSKLMDISMADFSSWNTINFPEDVFFHLYDNNLDLKERLDDIYKACSDDDYLVNEHLNKFTG